MLLREAGFASGVISGFAPKREDESVTLAEAHAVNFALYPSGGKGLRPVLLDGTPAGLTAEEERLLSGLRLSSLEKRELEAEENLIKLREAANEKLEEILKILKSKDKAAIQKLSNGQLEQIVNMILGHEVREEHFRKVLAALDAFWYTPYKDAGIEKAEEFISGVLKETAPAPAEEEEPQSAGRKLFELLEDYMRRFKKSGKAKTDVEALDLMQEIFDSIEGSLSHVESRAAAAVIAYLKVNKKL